MKSSRPFSKSKKKKRWTLKLSDHFSKRDFVCRCGKCNQLVKVSLGLVGGLEWLREKLGQRITILKGYMCADAVDQHRSLRRNFYHMGVAAQIKLETGDQFYELLKTALSIPEFKGIGIHIETHVLHLDTRKSPERLIWIEKNDEVTPITEADIDSYFTIQSQPIS